MAEDKNKLQMLVMEVCCSSDPVIITTRKGKKHLDLNKSNDLPFEEEQIERDPAHVLGFDP